MEENAYWWKGTATPLSQTRVSTISDGIRAHVKGKKSSATQSQTVEQSLADFNYGGTPDDLLIMKASTNRIFS